MANNHILTAVFAKGSKTVETVTRYQYDYGQRLQYVGIPDLPRYYEVHFCNAGSNAMTKRVIGDAAGVDIPDTLFTSGANVIAYLYLHDEMTDGTTVYTATIPVEARPMPSDYSGSPTDPDVLGQAVALLNHEIQDIEHAAEHAAEATASATLAESWAVGGTGTREGEDTDNAMYYAGQAHDHAANAYGSETAAATSATHAAQAEDTVTALVEGIPSDYTELSNAVEELATDKLGRIQSPGYGNLGLVIGANGEVIPGELRLPQAVQTALLDVFQHVAYVDEHGAEALAALEAAMEVKVLESITAVINQGATVIYTDAGLDQLRPLMTVTATYSDGTTATVTDYELLGVLYAGECVIGVTYGIGADTVTVTATQPDVTVVSISAAFSQGSATIYPTTPIDNLRQYLTVTALYSNGMTAPVYGYTIDGTLRTGTCTLTARFRGAAGLFNVTVTTPSVVSISATYNPPAGFNVYSDDELDVIALYLNVIAHYNDGSDVSVSGFALSGTLTPGTSTITIAWSGFTTSVQVTVLAAAVSIDAVYDPPADFIVIVGDDIDVIVPYLTVTVHYSDSTSTTVSDYTLTGEFVSGASTITVAWDKFTASVQVDVIDWYNKYTWDTSAGDFSVVHNTCGIDPQNGAYIDARSDRDTNRRTIVTGRGDTPLVLWDSTSTAAPVQTSLYPIPIPAGARTLINPFPDVYTSGYRFSPIIMYLDNGVHQYISEMSTGLEVSEMPSFYIPSHNNDQRYLMVYMATKDRTDFDQSTEITDLTLTFSTEVNYLWQYSYTTSGTTKRNISFFNRDMSFDNVLNTFVISHVVNNLREAVVACNGEAGILRATAEGVYNPKLDNMAFLVPPTANRVTVTASPSGQQYWPYLVRANGDLTFTQVESASTWINSGTAWSFTAGEGLAIVFNLRYSNNAAYSGSKVITDIVIQFDEV